MPVPHRVRLIGLVAALVLVVGLLTVVGVRMLLPSDGCEVTVSGTTVELDPEQAERAGLVAGLAVGRGLPARAATVALTVGLAESGLDRLPGGSRDGVLALLEEIAAVPGYREAEVQDVAAEVGGGESGEYADHVPDARVLASALSGNSEEALSCTVGGEPEEAPDELERSGLVARAERVRADLTEVFGPLSLGGFEPGGVSTGHMEGSAHYEGRAVDAFFRPVNAANQIRGWAVAQYLVTQAERLAIRTVIYDDRIWTSGWRSGEGWRDYDPPSRSGSMEILEHRDHVHVDVFD